MGERKIKPSKKRRLSDEDWLPKRMKKVKNKNLVCTPGISELKIVLKKISLSQLKCSDTNKENGVSNDVKNVRLTPRLNLCRIDAVIPNASKSFSPLKMDDDDKQILLRHFRSEYMSSKTSQNEQGFEKVTTHNMVSVSSKSYTVSSERVNNAEQGNNRREIFTDLKNVVETSFRDSHNDSEDFANRCDKHFCDKVDSTIDKNEEICNLVDDEILMKNALLPYDNDSSYRRVLSNYSRKELSVRLNPLNENGSQLYKRYVENKYLEAGSKTEEIFDNQEKKILEKLKLQQRIGINFHSKKTEIKEKSTEVIMESYTKTIKDCEVSTVVHRSAARGGRPCKIKRARRRPGKINSGSSNDFENLLVSCPIRDISPKSNSDTPSKIKRTRGRPRKINNGSSNVFENPSVSSPARDIPIKSNSGSSKDLDTAPVRCRTRRKSCKSNHGSSKDVDVLRLRESVCDRNRDSDAPQVSRRGRGRPRKINSASSKNVDVSPVGHSKKGRRAGLCTRSIISDKRKTYSDSAGVKSPSCKSASEKETVIPCGNVGRKKIVKNHTPSTMVTRRRATSAAVNEMQTNVWTSQVHEELHHHMEIEETTTTKNFKSEELQNFSLNSIVILHSTKDNAESKKKPNVSFYPPNGVEQLTLKSIYNSSLTLKRCEIPASSTPYLEKSKKNCLDLSVTLTNACFQNQIDLEDESDEGFIGFKDSSISSNHISIMSSKSVVSPTKCKRLMSRKEADARTESFNLCKKALESNVKTVKSSKQVAVKETKSNVLKTAVRTSRRLALKQINHSSPVHNNVTLEYEKVETEKIVLATPYVVLNKLSYADISSYKITPLREDRIPIKAKTAEDYGIDDVNTDDSTDDENFPKKRIPEWAQDMKDGVLETCQSFLSRDLVHQWIRPPNYSQPMHSVFFK